MNGTKVETIIGLTPIVNADSIELALIQGWDVVVRKGEFIAGDKCVFIPIDHLVDSTKPHFAHLAAANHSNWIKINSRKMRGVWSQGLVVALTALSPEIVESVLAAESSYALNDLLGVQKYQKEIALTMIKGVPAQKAQEFPCHVIPKTDEANLRSYPSALQELHGKECYITKKMDGSSMTMIVNVDGTFTVCSRNIVLDVGSVMYQYVIQEGLEEKLRALGYAVAVQCEFCGPGVNGNQMKLKKYDIYMFNIKKLTAVMDNGNTHGEFCGLQELQEIATTLGVKTAPVLDTFQCDETWTVKRFQEYANTVTYEDTLNRKKLPGEGIVIRPVVPVWSYELQKCLSVKVINQNYKD